MNVITVCLAAAAAAGFTLFSGFGLMEILPRFQTLWLLQRFLPLGGILSGFFGGLSGHQGAFRSAFLAKSGLSTQAFLGTGAAIAALVDLARIPVYGQLLRAISLTESGPVPAAATSAAFLGTWVSFRRTGKVAIQTVQVIVAVFLFGFAIGLAGGLI
jgi:hypothetical protein